eukprot:Ihof_evm4s235 gene=Ihof_evmTU4s235
MKSLLLLFLLATVCQALSTTVPVPDNWAVLVAGSQGWYNYRHQADVAHAYKILIDNGYPRDHIITMMVDDIAHNDRNPNKGWIINRKDGENLYPNLIIDYSGNDVTPEIFEKILLGQPTNAGNGKTLLSGPYDHVFINFVGHGSTGYIIFPFDQIITAVHLNDILLTMHSQQKYARLVFYLETCKSGSMFEDFLPNDVEVYANAASNGTENSYNTYWSNDHGTFLGDEYSVSWMEELDDYFYYHPQSYTLQNLFELVQSRVRLSEPFEYGDLPMSRIFLIDEFFQYKQHKSRSRRLGSPRVASKVVRQIPAPPTACEEGRLDILQRRALMQQNSTGQEKSSLELEEELQGRKEAKERFQALTSLVAGSR